MGPRRHTSRHTSPEDGDARHSRKATASSSVEGSLPSSLTKGISIIKKQKERAFSLPGKLPAPYKSRDFSLRFGSGSPLPLIIAWSDDYLWTWPSVWVRRQTNWSMTSRGHVNTRQACRQTAAIGSYVWCISKTSSLNFFSPCAHQSIAQPELYKAGPLVLSSSFTKNYFFRNH